MCGTAARTERSHHDKVRRRDYLGRLDCRTFVSKSASEPVRVLLLDYKGECGKCPGLAAVAYQVRFLRRWLWRWVGFHVFSRNLGGRRRGAVGKVVVGEKGMRLVVVGHGSPCLARERRTMGTDKAAVGRLIGHLHVVIESRALPLFRQDTSHRLPTQRLRPNP
jgi:hypothetical protein